MALLVAAGLLGAGYMARDAVDSTTAQPTAAQSAASTPAGSADNGANTPAVTGASDEPVAAVASALGPAVVQIKTDQGLGSGTVYDKSGLILTNDHVVTGSKTVQVSFADGTTRTGTVVGSDPSIDIGVVKVDPPANLAVARLASGDPKVGELAVAMGSPFGLEQTVTAGIVSAVNRPVQSEGGIVVPMIQTDAPINPGNSGGALANRRGELIGVPTQIYSQKGENNGVGFAVPIAKAKAVADRIVAGKPVDIAFLGVSDLQATDDGSPGAVVGSIERGGPAGQGGLQSGDVIVAVDGQSIRQPVDLPAAIADKAPGDQVTLDVRRNGQSTKVTVTLGTRPNTSN